MNLEKLFKYLEFLKAECLRYASDNHTDENEVNLLQLEINKFKSTLHNSNLDNSIKKLVSKIDFELTPKSRNRFLDILTLIFSFEWRYYGRDDENMANKLNAIALDIENTIFELKAYH